MDGPDQATLPLRPLTALLDQSVARFPGRPAMSFLGRRWSYAQLGALVDRAAAGLAAHGVARGTRVGLCLPNTPYSVVFYYAVLRLGAVVVNLNPLYVERELISLIRDSGLEVMVTTDLALILPKVERASVEAGVRTVVVCPFAAALPPGKAALFRALKRRDLARPADRARIVTYARLIRAGKVPAALDPPVDPVRELAVLQYTGGTTGLPKAAMLTHGNLTANAAQVAAHMPSLRLGAESVVAVLPLFHVFAMTSVMNASVAIGAEIHLLPRFEIGQLLALIERTRPTILYAVPTIYGAINAACDARPRDLSSLRACVSGGAPMPAEVQARFEALTGCPVCEGYGLSEASPCVTSNRPDSIRAGTIGVPMLGTRVEIRDPDDLLRAMPPGERGEVCVRGPQVMAGYWNRPEESAASFTPDGFLRTGDIGLVDADGYFSLVDRIKDLILCGGYNVYPRVIEEALYQHPDVAEAVVIGVPDAYRGEAPKAFVTLRTGHHAEPDAIRAFLGDYVSKIEMPREVVIRDSLPKTMIGKLSKKELVAEEAAARA